MEEGVCVSFLKTTRILERFLGNSLLFPKKLTRTLEEEKDFSPFLSGKGCLLVGMIPRGETGIVRFCPASAARFASQHFY